MGRPLYQSAYTGRQNPVGYVYGTIYAVVKRVLIQKKAEAGFYNLKRTDLTFETLAAEVWLHSLQNSIKESTHAHYSYTLHKYLLPGNASQCYVASANMPHIYA